MLSPSVSTGAATGLPLADAGILSGVDPLTCLTESTSAKEVVEPRLGVLVPETRSSSCLGLFRAWQ